MEAQQGNRYNIGNANSYQASQISTLNNVPANSNLNFVSDDSDMHLYDPTTLNNKYLYSTFETADITQQNVSSGESSSIVMQFSNPNWVDTSEVFLEWPVKLTVTTPAVINTDHNYIVDPILVNNPMAALCCSANIDQGSIPIYSYNPSEYADLRQPYQPTTTFDNGYYPNDAVIQLFSQIQVYGGTNNQPLGRTTMFQQPNLSVIGQVDKMSQDTATIWGYSGVSISSCQETNQLIARKELSAAGKPWKSINDNYILSTGNVSNKTTRVPFEAMQSFEKVIRMASMTSGATYIQGANSNTFTNTFVISIPMSKISEWFKANKSIPPEFRYKLTFNYYNNPVNVYTGFLTKLQDDIQVKSDVKFFLSSNVNPATGGSLPQLKYRSYVLNPTIQEGLNLKWSANPFTYNIESSEPYVMNNYPYNAVISTSQQRPLELMICVFAINDKQDGSEQYQKNSLVPWLDENGQAIDIKEINIYVSGKTVISYTNQSTTQNDFIPTGFENIIARKQGQCALGYSPQPGDNQSVQRGTFTTNTLGAPIIIPIAPGMLWDNSIYPTDQGAIQLKLVINTSKKLHPDFSITVFKKFTSQVSVDINLKTSLTEWPARIIQSQAGNTSALVQPNVIPGN
jgi:hypothetical protein